MNSHVASSQKLQYFAFSKLTNSQNLAFFIMDLQTRILLSNPYNLEKSDPFNLKILDYLIQFQCCSSLSNDNYYGYCTLACTPQIAQLHLYLLAIATTLPFVKNNMYSIQYIKFLKLATC